MKIPLYQTEWLGVNLVDLAHKIDHDVSQIAGTKFYNKIYGNILNNKDFLLNQSWLEKKHNLSNWLVSFIKTNIPKDSAMLSVGCGFGVVETSLIQHGVNIDLQECQPYSIQYMQKKFPDVFEKTSFILSEDLSNIPSNSYDVILSLTSTYCLDQDTLLNFLKAIKRILKKNGVFVWYETVLSLDDLIYYTKSKILNITHQDSVLWGWKRTLHQQHSLAKKNGFKPIHTFYFDTDNVEIWPRKFMKLPYGDSVAWQAGVYRYD